MIIRSFITIKVYQRFILLDTPFTFILITEESTPKSLLGGSTSLLSSGSLFVSSTNLSSFVNSPSSVLSFFFFGYILVIYFCWLTLCLLLVDILRFFSKSCFLRINILSIIRRCIKRIIKLSFFF